MAIDYEGKYTIGEEIANSVTHGIGALLSVAGLSVLVTLAAIYGDAYRVVSFAVYGSTMILMYLASTFYHSFRDRKIKTFFRVFDHSAIFLLIAGTYTPFTLVTLKGIWGWTLFGLIWG
ncbi:MAG: hemolysin III family protein, partial [Deltaproteobacteria bacterium]|nr:hemolysin III family protein [Deltaproteobacteria bacterium]